MMKNLFLLFLIILLIDKVKNKKNVAFSSSLNEKELRDILKYSDESTENEESDIFGEQINSFFRESNTQLILDLDLFKEIWKELNNVQESTIDGNINYLEEMINFFTPIKEYDISAPCISDLFHFLWTTYNYAHTVRLAKNCNDCNCTKDFKNLFFEYQWIFDGKLFFYAKNYFHF